jgi:hypothetical protein
MSEVTENLKRRNQLEDIGVEIGIILKWIFEEYGGKLWSGLILLSLGTYCGYLRTQL